MGTQSIDRGAGSNYRARLFWKWQAWRLRKAVPQESSRSVSLFSNFAALDHRGYADALCTLLETLCSRTGGRVATTATAVRARLKREIGLQSCVAVLATGSGAVGGYAWGRVTTGSEVIAQFRQAPGLSGLDESDWNAISAVVKDKPTLAFHDIGLDTHYRRGFSPLKQLLKPLFELGVTHRAQRALWWAQPGSALHAVSLAFGARAVVEREDCVFLQHSDIASIAHVLAVLPASEISDLLARVAPGRPVRTRDANATVPAIRDPQQPTAATSAVVAQASPVLVAADAVASNDADGGNRQGLVDGPVVMALASLPGGDTAAQAGVDAGTEAACPAALADPTPLHALPARLAALFPRMAS
jgi:hypothetical protein